MHSISIAIPAEAVDRLRDLARRERRSPRQQAAVLVIAALEREDSCSDRQPDREQRLDSRPANSSGVKP
jgi:hypothetical protein